MKEKDYGNFVFKFVENGFRKGFGFTLAEVLITLGIIGVVAAITIPILVENYQKKQVVAQLKESYSIMQQVFKLSQEENGEVESWDTTLNGHQFFERYIANYVKWTKEYTSSELRKEAPRTLLNGSAYTGTTYNGENSAHFTLLNGSMVSMNLNSSSEGGLWVGIDVNGLSKPNRVGRDTFLFFLSSEYGLRPLGEAGTPEWWRIPNGEDSRAIIKGTREDACAKGKNGYWCSALIAQDGWEIAGDYPWNGQ